jgi:cytochrome c peroxidase
LVVLKRFLFSAKRIEYLRSFYMKKVKIISILALLVVFVVRCSKNDAVLTPAEATANGLTTLPFTVNTPADNPQTAQKIALGRALFWDPITSGNKDVACASCHHPSYGFSDGLDLSIGVNGIGLGTARHFLAPNSIPFARRNSMSILNTAFNGMNTTGTYDPVTAAMFFDIRTRSLELQSLEPMKAMEEMRGNTILPSAILDTVVLRLKAVPQYSQLFSDAFGGGDAITIQNMGKAIAAFERTLVSNHSPYDAYIQGNTSAMTAAQIQGMTAFTTNGCIKCHSGPMFSDFALHVLSVPDNTKLPTDAGANGTYAFRTPSLRNLSVTAPYMHSGVFTDLNQVLNFYDQIGDGRSQNSHVNNNQLDGNLQRINNNDRASIIQFLNALNDPGFDKSIPATVPSGLHPGGNL